MGTEDWGGERIERDAKSTYLGERRGPFLPFDVTFFFLVKTGPSVIWNTSGYYYYYCSAS